MNIHGERYASVSLFVAYCRDLNVKTDEGELEYLEKVGAMFPVARVVFPDEYVIQMRQHELDDDRDSRWLGDWPDAIKLDDRVLLSPPQDEESLEKAFLRRIDREIAAGDNPYLLRPDETDFQPWAEYAVRIIDESGKDLDLPTTEHYYGYWQVYQLYFIRKFSGLYRGHQPIDPLPKWLPEFDGKRHCFDALSFWITVSSRERERTFANIVEKNGIKRLKDGQAGEHRERQRKLARMVEKRFHLDPRALYKFLGDLIGIYEGYEEDERYRLAEALKQDIFAAEHLLWFLTGATREEIADHLGVYRQTFRHLLIATKERDYALRVLIDTAQKCGDKLRDIGCSDWLFAEADAHALLEYCQREGLGLLPTALSGMNAVGIEEFRRKSRRVLRYTNLKNILTSYEYLLKKLGEKDYLGIGSKTLFQTIEQIMQSESWYKTFDDSRRDSDGKILLNGGNTNEFIDNLDTLASDPRLHGSVNGYWARTFLVTCLARNMTVHSYPSDDRYYGDLFGPMLEAVIAAIFYTWKMAQREGWTQA